MNPTPATLTDPRRRPVRAPAGTATGRDGQVTTVVDAPRPGLAVQASGLTKRYGRRTVVDRLDLEIPTGVVAGFVGPNGAGKTTTLRMLLGLVRPTAGAVSLLGTPLSGRAGYLRRVGALIDSPAFYPGLSGTRNLEVLATLAGLNRARTGQLLDRVGLGTRGGDPYHTYSLGMKQRLGIAAALLGDPELLILDEPANGLDPDGIRDMRHLVRSLAGQGPTLLISSHLLSEVQQICDWLIVIAHGRLLFQGPIEQLLARGERALWLRPESPADLDRLAGLLTERGRTPVRDGDLLRVPSPGRPTDRQTNPPTNPPTERQTNPPTDRPTNPPTNPPTERQTNPPTDRPTNPPTERQN